MTASSRDQLYELLPVLYRERDLPSNEGRQALRALLGLVTEQMQDVERDIDQLWDDLFVETCRPWVLPYIGDLVDNELLDDGRAAYSTTAEQRFGDLAGPDLRPPPAIRRRADVAKTIYYRRRKGTIAMLEELARDVTGWPVHAVEMFALLGWTQHVEHLRPAAGWVDVRSVDRMGRLDGPFDQVSHSVDVRPIARREGWHHVPNVVFFAWRLLALALANVPAVVADAPWRLHFNPLGEPIPLFSRGRREAGETERATELDVPQPIRPTRFRLDLAGAPAGAEQTALYGDFETFPESSLAVTLDGTTVPPARIVCRRLDPWPAAAPAGDVVAVDVVSGRLALGADLLAGGATVRVDVSFHHGFPARMGGGSYDRAKWLAGGGPRQLTVLDGAATAGTRYPTLLAALQRWINDGRPDTTITILDSRTYALPAEIRLTNEDALTIQAANRERPLLRCTAQGLRVAVDAPIAVPDSGDPERASQLTLNGVVVEGFVDVTGDLARLRLLHATLVPGRGARFAGATGPSIIARSRLDGREINVELEVELAFSICGPIVSPERARAILALDSILDGRGGPAVQGESATAGPPLEVERSTILGGVRAHFLEASETIFTGTVEITRTQGGCVRFSSIPPGSRTPRRYRCQPDLAVEAALAARPGLAEPERAALVERTQRRVVPTFVSLRYGRPTYAQLKQDAPPEITSGAADGSELGAYQHTMQRRRANNLEIRFREYLPLGLDAGVVFVT